MIDCVIHDILNQRKKTGYTYTKYYVHGDCCERERTMATSEDAKEILSVSHPARFPTLSTPKMAACLMLLISLTVSVTPSDRDR